MPFSIPVTLILMTLIYKLDMNILTCTCIPKMKLLGQGFQKLQQRTEQTDATKCAKRATSAAGNKSQLELNQSITLNKKHQMQNFWNTEKNLLHTRQ